MNDDIDGEWNEWKRLIIHEIRRLNTNLEKTTERCITVESDVSRLKLVSALWGALGGIIITIVVQKVISGI